MTTLSPAGIVLDFYGTVVVDDDAAVAAVSAAVADLAADSTDAASVVALWWQHFERSCTAARGPDFRRMSELATNALARTLDDLSVIADAECLAGPMLAYWRAPEVFADAGAFLDECPLPICLLSDVDRADLDAAVDSTGVAVPLAVSSDDVQAYKPASDGFRAAAEILDLPLDRLWHVGDAVTSDIAGANALGITSVWINRQRRARAVTEPAPSMEVADLLELLAMLEVAGG